MIWKKIIVMMLILVLTGCSLKQPKIIYIEPKKVSFEIPKIDLVSPGLFAPTDIKIVENGTKIITSVDTFLKIKTLTTVLRLQRDIYKIGYESMKRQIELYRKKVKP